MKTHGAFFRILVLVSIAFLAFGGCSKKPESKTKERLLMKEDMVDDTPTEAPDWAEDKDAPLKVLLTNPHGETKEVAQVLVAFNKPMVEMTTLDQRSAAVPLSITPPVEGAFHWLGTSTLGFESRDPFPKCTEYKVTVGKDFHSVEGEKLGKDFSWSFETPRVEVVSTTPNPNSGYNETYWVTATQTLVVEFNQPVTLKDAGKNLILRENDSSKEIPVSLRHPKEGEDPERWPKPDRVVLVKPKRRMNLNTSYLLRIDKQLHGKEGPLPMKKDFTLHFSTYGPLKVTHGRYECARQYYFEFSTPVNYKEFIKNIKVSPKVELPDTGEDLDTYSTFIYYPPSFAPGKYTVTVSGALTDKFGQKLGKDYVFEETIRDYDPELMMKADTGVVESNGPHKFPLYVINLKEARIRIANITHDQIIPFYLLGGHLRKEYVESLRHEYDKEQQYDLKTNARSVEPIELDPGLKGGKSGFLFLNADKGNVSLCDYREPQDLETSAVVQVTDIGLMAKRSDDKILVWATSLKTGRPIPGAKISVYSNSFYYTPEKRYEEMTLDDFHYSVSKIWSGVTGKDGLAAGGVARANNQYVVAEKDGQTAFMNLNWDDGLSLYNFEVPTHRPRPVQGLIFTERKVYRPGETVHFKGILRENKTGSLKTPANEKTTVRIVDRENKEILNKKFTLNRFGTFSGTVKAPPKGTLGYYSIYANLQGVDIYGGFRVEEYRAPEFEVNIASPKDEYIFGDKVSATVEGKYLFGAVMKKADVEWVVRQERAGFAPPELDDYIFDDNVWRLEDESSRDVSEAIIAKRKGALKGNGRLEIKIPSKQGARPGSRSYEIEATVIDENRQAVSGRKSLLLHQGEYYIGMKPDKTFMKTGDTLSVGVLTARPDGKRAAGKKVALTLYRREWHTVNKKGLREYWYYESAPVDKKIDSCNLKTGNRPSTCKFKVSKAGFLYVRAKSTDGRGNSIVSSFGVYSTGREYVSWQRENHNRIELVTDKKLYKPGDVATILVKSPYKKAKALITTEREGIISQEVVELNGTAETIQVKITEKSVPNFAVSALLVQGRTAEALDKDGLDSGKPSFRVGYVNLNVDYSHHELDVEIKPDKTDYRPRDTVTLTIRTKKASGKSASAEVAVMVVDEGVLSLTGYETPNPLSTFYSTRGILVGNSTSYIHIIDRVNYGKKGHNPGGSGKGGGYNLVTRNLFATCAFWNPSVVTDKKGTATVTFKLPDNLTKYRIMAVANTRGADFGAGESSLRVNKPLMVRPSLPRFAVAGDTIIAGAVLHNYGEKAGRATLGVSVKGMHLDDVSEKTSLLSPDRAKEVRFRFKANKSGTAKFTFTATMGGESDSVEASIPVIVPKPTEAVAAYGVTVNEAKQKIVAPKGVFKDVGGLDVSVSSTALSGLEQGLAQVVEYPYGCIEQHVSRALPLILLEDIASEYNIAGLENKKLRTVVQDTLDKVIFYQRSNGGMTYWPEGYCDSPYLSAYTFLLLNEASRAGYRVDSGLHDGLMTYLDGVIRGKIRICGLNESIPPALSAFILYVLAEAGNPLLSFQNNLYEYRNGLDLSGKAFLAAAMSMSGGDRRKIKELVRELQNHARLTGAEAHFEIDYETDNLDTAFYSDDWLTAVILTSLIKAEPGNSLVPKTARWLLKVRVNGRWRNTHEAAFALMALSKYYKKFEAKPPRYKAEVRLGKKRILSTAFDKKTTRVEKVRVPINELIGIGEEYLTLEKKGKGLLYYSVHLSYAMTKRHILPRDEGFIVTTEYRQMGEKEPLTKFKAGDVVQADITVITPMARNYVVIEDPVPAGFEIVNQTFTTSSKELFQVMNEQSGGYEDECYEDECEYYDFDRDRCFFNHVDIHDDSLALFANQMPAGVCKYSYVMRATTSGVFFDRATKAEEMYTPEIFGRTGTRTIVVK